MHIITGSLCFAIKDEQLYISDPRALQSILIKDQDTYDETDVFLEYVWFHMILIDGFHPIDIASLDVIKLSLVKALCLPQVFDAPSNHANFRLH
jgi:hypothetical protein